MRNLLSKLTLKSRLLNFDYYWLNEAVLLKRGGFFNTQEIRIRNLLLVQRHQRSETLDILDLLIFYGYNF